MYQIKVDSSREKKSFIDNLVKKIEYSCKLYAKSYKLINDNQHLFNSRIFNTNTSLIEDNKNKNNNITDDVNDNNDIQLNSTKDKLLNLNHSYSLHNNFHVRKWFFNNNTCGDATQKCVFLCNENGSLSVISRNIDERKTRLSILKNKQVDIWYLKIFDNFINGALGPKSVSYKFIDQQEISEYIDDIERSEQILFKNYEIKSRLSDILGNITFHNTFEFGWHLNNAYKITVKKYVEDYIYLEDRENKSTKNRKVKISENKLIRFIEKNKDVFEKIKTENTEHMHKMIEENEKKRNVQIVDEYLDKIKSTRTMNYNDMTLEYRIQIHKTIQKRHPELFIRKSAEKRYTIQSCKAFLEKRLQSL